MQVSFDLKIGTKVYKLTEEVHSHTEFFKKMAFYADLPEVGPNGETDLVLTYRNPQNYEYYSIVSKQAGMELRFGQLKEPEGELFKKDWEPLYQPEQNAQSNAVQGGLGAPVAQQQLQQYAHPVGLGANPVQVPVPAQTMPTPLPAAVAQPQVTMPVQQAAPAPVVVQQPAQPAANPAVNTAAAQTLAKYGL